MWPTRKETLQTTGIVFAFVVVMALFLWAVDASLLWVVQEADGHGRMMSKKWYVVHAYSGFEKSVQRALLDRIPRAGMQDQFGQILVPVEEVVEMKSGQKNISERKFFPGYVLVEMEMTDDTWHLVKNTPKVTGFVGGTATKPTPISEKEVQNILHQIQEGVEKPRPEGAVRSGRGGAREGRSVRGLPRQRRGRELRQEQAARVGDDLRPLDAGGAGFRAGREGLSGRIEDRVERSRGSALVDAEVDGLR